MLRVVFLIFRAPFQAQPMVICGYFFTFTASLCGIVVQYRLRTKRPGFESQGGPLCLPGVRHTNACVVSRWVISRIG